MDDPSLLLGVSFSYIHGILIAIIIFLLAGSAFFSMSETAYSSMNVIRVRSMAENKVKGARRALYIAEHSDRALTTTLVGNNIVNILSTTLCAYILSSFITSATLYNILNTVVMTIIILIIGEILPKAYAKAHPETIAIKISGFMYVFMKLSYPLVICFYGLQKLFTKRKTANETNVTVTEDELEDIIDTMEEEGVLEDNESDIIQGALKIKDVTVENIMTHRVDVVFLELNATEKEIEKTFIENKYSRIPIYKGTVDNVVGILNFKDVFEAKMNGQKINIKELMSKPLFTADNTNVDTLIREMQKKRNHMAVVLDDNGGVSGIVTFEDCVEMVFGEIYDETDEDEKEPIFEKIAENEYKIDADMYVEDLFDRLEIETMPENPYQTISSFVFDLSEDVPSIGEKITYDTIDEIIDDEGNLTRNKIRMIFTVTKLEDHRIEMVNLQIVNLDEQGNETEKE